ncbi:MAG: hypothetical protein JWR56_176 [Massilia sp.]|nr:hypothetical protein [Massilia sp.]
MGDQSLEVGPQCGADEPNPLERHDFTFEPGNAETVTSFSETSVRFIKLKRIEFVIARDV